MFFSSYLFIQNAHDAQADCLLQAPQRLLNLAAGMPRLRAFLHVSTAYVNGNLPKGSFVPEEPCQQLTIAGRAVQHEQLVTELQELPEQCAEQQVGTHRVASSPPMLTCNVIICHRSV